MLILEFVPLGFNQSCIIGNIMNVVQNLMERLRPLVGVKSWDYCVLWKLSEDRRLMQTILIKLMSLSFPLSLSLSLLVFNLFGVRFLGILN
jgi:hypothetical protein